ncbi:MAG: AAA family ATPase [Planctomycetota bacterium]
MALSEYPTVTVIAGPNGAGKTTFANRFLPANVAGKQFLNADLIAAGLSPFDPESQKVRAGRLVIERMRELVAARESFGFETTLAGRGYAKKLAAMSAAGYRVLFFFLWLPDAEWAVRRVAGRVREGGHDVPDDDIRRRYRKGLVHFFDLFAPIADEWELYDASALPPRLVVESTNEGERVVDAARYHSSWPPMRRRDMANEAGERPLRERAADAFDAAARDVIERARRCGTPIVTSCDGKLVEMTPDEAEAEVAIRKTAREDAGG